MWPVTTAQYSKTFAKKDLKSLDKGDGVPRKPRRVNANPISIVHQRNAIISTILEIRLEMCLKMPL